MLLEAVASLKNDDLIIRCIVAAVKLANAAIEGLDTDGGLCYEYEPSEHLLLKQKHWCPKAEAIVGFINARQVSKEEKYLQHTYRSWQFIQQFILDKKNGKLFWEVNEDYITMKEEDKVGIWKCPYHNSRVCIEIIIRLSVE